MTRLVLFDIDGTLISTGGAGMTAFERTFALEFGVRNAAREINFAGRTDTGILQDFFRNHAVEPSEENFQRFFHTYVHWLDYQLQTVSGRILPGVINLLRELKCLARRPALGLLTGNLRLGAQIKLRHFNLWDHFEIGAFGCEHSDRNEIAKIALKRGRKSIHRRMKGEEILVIGDTTRDIDCANAIGARCLAVATGGDSLAELRRHNPTRAVRDLARVTAEEICA